MRTLVDIPGRQIKELAYICMNENVSRAELIRRAISSYIENKKSSETSAFGLWKDRKLDGLKYQEQLHSEW